MRAMTQADVAQVYDQRAGIPFDGSTNQTEIAGALAMLATLAPSREARILDVGCGAGWHLSAMAAAGYRRLYGMDVSSASLRLAAERCAATKVILILGDIGAASFSIFDVVTAFNASFGSFGEAGDQRFLDGIARGLTPGGQLLMSYVGPEVARRRVGRFRVRYSEGSAIEMVSEVRIAAEGEWLVVDQRVGGHDFPEERIRILDRPSVARMLDRAGLDILPDADPRQAADLLRFVDMVVAAKRR